MRPSDLVVLGIAATCVVVVGAVGMVRLRRLRGRSLQVQILGIPLVVLVAVAASVGVDTRVMFLSSHDSGVVVLALAAAVPVAAALAVWLGRDVSRSARRLAEQARELGDGAVPTTSPLVSAELTTIGTELARAGHELATTRTRAAAVEGSRRELVAWVSHDLRTPLAGIRAMAEALEDGVATEPAAYHKQIRVEADRLSGMVDTLFLLSRLHSGSMQPAREQLAMHDLVSDAVASIRPVADARGLRLVGGAEPDAVARVDPALLSRALSNLLGNAVRHTRDGGTVTVTARRSPGGDAVTLSVHDQCGGIRPDDLPRLFDIGWRGADGRTGGSDGRGGYGLAVTRGIVEAHGGTIQVHNADGGCRFVIRVPVE
jgi:signal transduction histidine kinase